MTDKPIISKAATSLEGKSADSFDPKSLYCAIDEAFDYRGDVTITLSNGKIILILNPSHRKWSTFSKHV